LFERGKRGPRLFGKRSYQPLGGQRKEGGRAGEKNPPIPPRKEKIKKKCGKKRPPKQEKGLGRDKKSLSRKRRGRTSYSPGNRGRFKSAVLEGNYLLSNEPLSSYERE